MRPQSDSLLDHFINEKSYQHKQCTECLLGCLKESEFFTASIRASVQINFFLVVKQSQEVWGALLAHTARGDVSYLCVWVTQNGVSRLTTCLRVFFLFFFPSVQSCMLGLSVQLLVCARKSTEVLQSNQPINTVRGREVCVLQS